MTFRVLLVQMPAQRIVHNILPDRIEVSFVADDVLVVVALPDRGAGYSTEPVDAARGGGFERAQHGRQRAGRRFREPPLHGRCRGMACHAPTLMIAKQKNSVHVVRHDDEGIQRDMRKMIGNRIPAIQHDLTRRAQPHFPVHHRTKQDSTFMGADRYEIRSGPGVIILGQAHRSPMTGLTLCHSRVLILIGFHDDADSPRP